MLKRTCNVCEETIYIPDQEDWRGEFYMMDVRDGGVVLINPFVGDEVETLSFDEFLDLEIEGSFQEVSKDVVRDPSSLVEELIHEANNAISGDSSGFHNYMPWNVDFAITATNVSNDDDAPYMQTVD
jgi:hypothetical protein